MKQENPKSSIQEFFSDSDEQKKQSQQDNVHAECKKQKDALKKQITSLNSSIERFNKAINDGWDRYNKVKEDVVRLEEQKKVIKAELEELKLSKSGNQDANQQWQQKYNQLTKQLQKYKAQAQGCQEANTQLMRKFETTQEIVEKAQHQKLGVQQQNQKLKQSNQKLNIQFDISQTTIRGLESNIKDLESNIRRLESNLQGKIEEIKQFQQAQRMRVEQSSVIPSTNEEIQKLQDEINEKIRDNIQIKKENSKLKTQKSNLQKMIQQLNKMIKQQSSKTSDNSKLEELTTSVETFKGEKKQLQLTIADLKKQLDQRQSSKEDLRQSGQLVKNLMNKITVMKGEQQKTQHQRAEMSQKLDRVNEQLKKAKKELDLQRDGYQQKINRLNQDYDKLKQQLSSNQNEAEKEDLSASNLCLFKKVKSQYSEISSSIISLSHMKEENFGTDAPNQQKVNNQNRQRQDDKLSTSSISKISSSISNMDEVYQYQSIEKPQHQSDNKPVVHFKSVGQPRKSQAADNKKVVLKLDQIVQFLSNYLKQLKTGQARSKAYHSIQESLRPLLRM